MFIIVDELRITHVKRSQTEIKLERISDIYRIC